MKFEALDFQLRQELAKADCLVGARRANVKLGQGNNA
jgi:hypothetical protein